MADNNAVVIPDLEAAVNQIGCATLGIAIRACEGDISLAEDICQEFWTTIVQCIHDQTFTFPTTRLTLLAFFRTFRNRQLSNERRHGGVVRRNSRKVADFKASHSSYEEEIDSADFVQQLLLRCDEIERTYFKLRFVERVDDGTIAQRLKISTRSCRRIKGELYKKANALCATRHNPLKVETYTKVIDSFKQGRSSKDEAELI